MQGINYTSVTHKAAYAPAVNRLTAVMHTRFACMLLIGLVTTYMGRRTPESGVDRLEVLTTASAPKLKRL